MREVAFGYYPQVIEWTMGNIQVKTLDSIEQSVDDVTSDPGVEKDWVFAPDARRRDFLSGVVTTLPYKSRVFGLPKTHILAHATAQSDDHMSFLVWGLAFLVGMRLTTTEAGFLDSTPIKPGALHDMVWLRDSLPNAFTYVDAFWKRHSLSTSPKTMAGAIHAYFLSQGRNLLEYEKFIYLYIALDACYRIFERSGKAPKKDIHAGRVETLCRHFGMDVPKWAVAEGSEIASVRNSSLHEGIFFNEPLGFTVYGGNSGTRSSGWTVLQMTAMVSRLILGLLDVPAADYIRSPINTRSCMGVSVESASL